MFGAKLETLGGIIQYVKKPERIGVCIDTCHLFAAGYPLTTTRQYNDVIDVLDRSIGISRICAWHLNDSLKGLGSRVDRHAGIGLGLMGLEPFKHVINDKRFNALPMILETPKGTNECGEDLDVVNLRVLRNLVKTKKSRS